MYHTINILQTEIHLTMYYTLWLNFYTTLKSFRKHRHTTATVLSLISSVSHIHIICWWPGILPANDMFIGRGTADSFTGKANITRHYSNYNNIHYTNTQLRYKFKNIFFLQFLLPFHFELSQYMKLHWCKQIIYVILSIKLPTPSFLSHKICTIKNKFTCYVCIHYNKLYKNHCTYLTPNNKIMVQEYLRWHNVFHNEHHPLICTCIH
jgi:hypothetical protein